MIKGAIFDVDGTLLASLRAVLKKLGLYQLILNTYPLAEFQVNG